MSYQSLSAMSPGGLLLQKLGLQEQIMLANQQQQQSMNINGGGIGGVGATSLLGQQLEEYSQVDLQQQQLQNNQFLSHQQQSFASNASAPLLNSNSFHGGDPMALANLQNATFGDLSSSQMQQNAFPGAAMYPNGSDHGQQQQHNAPNNGGGM